MFPRLIITLYDTIWDVLHEYYAEILKSKQVVKRHLIIATNRYMDVEREP
jgi:hypothetical protein